MTWALVCLLTAWPQQAAGNAPAELAVNGSFEQGTESGRAPLGWSWPSANAEWVREGNRHWIRLRDNASVGQTIKLEPDWWKIRVSVRVRCQEVVRGEESWHDARVAMMFADEKGERVGDWPSVLNWTGTFDWREEAKDFTIPRGSKALVLSCSIFNTQGIVEFDDLSVTLISNYPKVEDAPAPVPVQELWSAQKAWKQETATRGRLCINGLWQLHPQGEKYASPPPSGTGWGWIKVPGGWAPGSGIQPLGPPIWEADEALKLSDAVVVWYRRKVDIPASWQGRRIFLYADNVVRVARVYVNGREVGEILWPDGHVDITSAVVPGQQAEVVVRANAMPMTPAEWEKQTAKDRLAAIRAVGVRGLAGDVFLEAEPIGPRVADLLTMPSVRRKALGLRLNLADLAPGQYTIEVEAQTQGKTARVWPAHPFDATKLQEGRLELGLPWPEPHLWDIDRPAFYDLVVRLRSADGKLLDESAPVAFGFREFWIEGRQVFLNGRPFHIRAFDFTLPSSSGGRSSREACEWALRRYRDLGMNFAYLSTYNLDWGQLRYFDGVMQAADSLGYALSVCMPHPRDIAQTYQDRNKRAYWERMARWVARRAANHPSVIMYAMSHNWLGHEGDQNPAFLDASFADDDPSLGEGRLKAREAARWAEQFVGQLDPTRPVYHHQCGSFGRWITLNCYLNWVPIQERMDWLSTYYHSGRKPVFLVEFGMPHHASFQRHRGGPFIWTNNVHAEPLNVEFAAMLFGDTAYNLQPENLAQYDTLERLYREKGTSFHFAQAFGAYWDQRIEKDFLDVKAEYTRYTWPAFRTWELAAVAPWDWSDMGRPRRGRVELKTDLGNLQEPGFRPDYVDVGDWYDEPPGKPTDYTVLGRELKRLSQDLLAYIGGKPEKFTSRDHLFAPGETVRKQLIFINDTPYEQVFSYRWVASVGSASIGRGKGEALVGAGRVAKQPLSFKLPALTSDTEGELALMATVNKRGGPNLQDKFAFQVLIPRARPRRGSSDGDLCILDPAGVTTQALKTMGVPVHLVQASGEAPTGLKALIIGREALRSDEASLWSTMPTTVAEQALPPKEHLNRHTLEALPGWVADFVGRGGRVLVCEQTERVLSHNFGFRTAFPGTRQVFARCPWHPVLRGLGDDALSLWRGEPTLTVAYTQCGPLGDPTVDWLGFRNSRVWKWGSYGQVATAVIEKPHTGDFLALADCEFDLDYSPLLEYRHPGGGAVLFCQLDISERTEPDPAVQRLWGNLIEWLAQPEAKLGTDLRRVVYVGGPRGAALLAELGCEVDAAADLSRLGFEALVVVGEDAGDRLGAARQALSDAVSAGTTVFCLPQQPADLASWAPFPVTLEERKVTHTLPGRSDHWLLRGLGPSELHWRGSITVEALSGLPEGSMTLPTGIVGATPYGKGWFVFCQVSPEMFDDEAKPFLRLSRQRCAQMLSRLLANCGCTIRVPLLQNLTRVGALTIDLSGEWAIRLDPEEQGDAQKWFAADLDDSGWKRLAAPGFWEDAGVGMDKYDGVAWLRRHFTVTGPVPEEGLYLIIGCVDDEDWTYVNGRLVGHLGQDTNPDDYWSAQRRYHVAAELLRQGENVVAVKVRDLRGGGGIGKGPIKLAEEERWLGSYYVNRPVASDDPYRYTRW